MVGITRQRPTLDAFPLNVQNATLSSSPPDSPRSHLLIDKLRAAPSDSSPLVPRKRAASNVDELDDSLIYDSACMRTLKKIRFHRKNDLCEVLSALPHAVRLRLPNQFLNVQEVADFLAEEGFLDYYALSIFADSDEIDEISLSTSLGRPFLDKRDVIESLAAFAKPGMWTSLISLDLSNVPLLDYWITLLQHLSSLQGLNLSSTKISFEASCHLIALRPTLEALDLSENAGINDKAMLNLALLDQLGTLAIEKTGVTMDGLFAFISAKKASGHARCQILLPTQCTQALQLCRTQVWPWHIIEKSNQVYGLNLDDVVKNLRYHALKIDGDSVTLRQRLCEHLETREQHTKCLNYIYPQA